MAANCEALKFSSGVSRKDCRVSVFFAQPNAWIQARRPSRSSFLLHPHIILNSSSFYYFPRFSLLPPLPSLLHGEARPSTAPTSLGPIQLRHSAPSEIGGSSTSKESAHPACAAIATLALTIATLLTPASRSEIHRVYRQKPDLRLCLLPALLLAARTTSRRFPTTAASAISSTS